MAEYIGIDKQYIMLQAIFTLVASTIFFSIASPWCCVPTAIFALATCFFVKNDVHAAFSAKELSPEFAEIITEKVVNNVELNAEDNSQSRSYLYETVLYSETRFHFYTPR
ncbi:hypothetical protein [Wolbachia endosymbiont of Trichogramma pretiosum]|uniref:hypothetical protein n=1 Tax=Wolbachia endosymbiont of Trichogramma pretiosum TaxID=125593 RepID=UPI000838F0F8|nr:hypothetical protein [Wolbachia endosymbiont of Trichogramma pretiosum]OCA06057.1 hypothetical protein wTpre_379 [Wolbachia endosymbiont of Trichogramma pretiosum]